jgi:hypothetical protein
MFSELGDLLEPCHRAIQPQLLAAIQCVRRWRKDGFGGGNEVAAKASITNNEMDALYGLDTRDNG